MLIACKLALKLLVVIIGWCLAAVATGFLFNFILDVKIALSLFAHDDPSYHVLMWIILAFIAGLILFMHGGATIAPGPSDGTSDSAMDAWVGRANAGWYSLAVIAMSGAFFAVFSVVADWFLWTDDDYYQSVPMNKVVTIAFMSSLLLGMLVCWVVEWRLNAPRKPGRASRRSKST